jgi:hypothetical protein
MFLLSCDLVYCLFIFISFFESLADLSLGPLDTDHNNMAGAIRLVSEQIYQLFSLRRLQIKHHGRAVTS